MGFRLKAGSLNPQPHSAELYKQESRLQHYETTILEPLNPKPLSCETYSPKVRKILLFQSETKDASPSA